MASGCIAQTPRAHTSDMKRGYRVVLVLCLVWLCWPTMGAQAQDCTKNISIQLQDTTVSTTVVLPYIGIDGYTDYAQEQLRQGVSPQAILAAISPNLDRGVEAMLRPLERPPVDARVVIQNGTVRYEDRQDGLLYDRRHVLLAICAALDGQSYAPLSLQPAQAAVDMAQCKRQTRTLATFGTDCADSSADRKHNLRLACRALDGYCLLPGQTFSFNTVVGKRTKEAGYRDGNVIVDGQFVPGVGGGVCQVSTTLYNAVLYADLPVTQLAAHSVPVHYVPLARDAMVSDWSDFCFENNTDSPVYIVACATEKEVQIRLLGNRETHDVRLSAVCKQTLPYADVDEAGNVLQDTAGYRCTQTGREGYVGQCSRYVAGQLRDSRTVRYLPKNAVWSKEATVPPADTATPAP